MDSATLVAFTGLGIAVLGAVIQFYRWIIEVKDRSKVLSESATKAEAERDSIAIKGAEGALLMMERMLEVARMSEGELRDRVRELEKESRDKDKQIQALTYENYLKDQRLAELESKYKSLESRISEQERKTDG